MPKSKEQECYDQKEAIIAKYEELKGVLKEIKTLAKSGKVNFLLYSDSEESGEEEVASCWNGLIKQKHLLQQELSENVAHYEELCGPVPVDLPLGNSTVEILPVGVMPPVDIFSM